MFRREKSKKEYKHLLLKPYGLETLSEVKLIQFLDAAETTYSILAISRYLSQHRLSQNIINIFDVVPAGFLTRETSTRISTRPSPGLETQHPFTRIVEPHARFPSIPSSRSDYTVTASGVYGVGFEPARSGPFPPTGQYTRAHVRSR